MAHAAGGPARRADRRDDPELVADLAQAADAGTLEDPDVVLTRTPLELDERGFKKLNKLLAKTHEQALAIAAESAARDNEARRRRLPDRAGVLHFKRGSSEREAKGPAVRRGPSRYVCRSASRP